LLIWMRAVGGLGAKKSSKRIRLVNLLSMICGGIGLFSLPFDWLTAPAWMVWEDVAAVVLFLCIPLLNRAGRTNLSRILFLLIANGIIFVDGLILGPQSGITLCFFGLAAFGLMLFDLSERWLIAFFTAIPVGSYFLFLMTPFSQGLYPMDAETSHAYLIYSSVIAFSVIALSTYFLQRTNEQSEADLKAIRANVITSEKMAALGEMSSNVAHEINNPLMALQLTSELLRRNLAPNQVLSEKVKELLGKLDRTVARIAKVTGSLQTFSRNAEGDPFVSASLSEIMSDTLDLCAERFRNSKVDLRVERLDPSLRLRCRPVQISQVLLNLLNNALYAVSRVKEKWVRLDFTVEQSQVRIRVTDSGEGVLPEIRHRLFEPFFTTKKAGEGTGLGLSISKGIVEAHGGRIFLEHERPNTEFVIELPKA
jgi:signal transduction histidine kinase